jgi:hypothetical protein
MRHEYVFEVRRVGENCTVDEVAVKHPPPALLLSENFPAFRNGPVATHHVGKLPFPPKPVSSVVQISLLNGSTGSSKKTSKKTSKAHWGAWGSIG